MAGIEVDSAWITTREAAKLLKRSERIVQEWGKEGKLERRPHPNNARTFAYNRAEVEGLAEITQKVKRATHAPDPKPETAVALRTSKQFEGSKPQLETMNVFLSVLDKAQRANEVLLVQIEKQAQIASETLKTVVGEIFAAQKADREDVFRRFDAERKDRQARLEHRSRQQAMQPISPKPKARGAHA